MKTVPSAISDFSSHRTHHQTLFWSSLLVTTITAGLAFTALALDPPPDGGYANSTTAEGDYALLSLTTGFHNTAMGWSALYHVTASNDNTAVGFEALDSCTGGQNTAVGSGALADDTTGF